MVLVSKYAGFCFGVQRAYNLAIKTIQEKKENEKIFTYGQLIHNKIVVDELKKKGIKIIYSESEVSNTVIIRSHGISNKIRSKIEKYSSKLIDATCPFVKRVHDIAVGYQKKGYHIIIIGDKDHPEIQGIIEDLENPIVISSLKEAKSIEEFDDIGVVVQTTFQNSIYQEIIKILTKKCKNLYSKNTICNATKKRQEDAEKIACKVDFMIVIGGKHSSNTKKLFDICSNKCKTLWIESANEIMKKDFINYKKIGITAGASTPKNDIDEIVNKIRFIW